MKKYAKFLIPLLVTSNVAIADSDLKVKLSGGFDFQAASYDDDSPKETRLISNNKKGFGFYSTADVAVNIENRLDEDTAFGGKIALQTTTRNNRKNPSMIYFESKAGKMEFGSDKSAVAKMKVTGGSSAVAAGGAWDSYAKTYVRQEKKLTYLTNSGNYTDSKIRELNTVEYARKITYFTPKWNGVQLGVSYTPDTSNSGDAKVKDADKLGKHVTNIHSAYSFDLKDAISWGANYENTFNGGLGVKLALVGETAKVVPKVIKPANATPGAKFKNLESYTAGAQFKYSGFSLSAAYGDYKKSFSSAEIDINSGKKISWYDVGLGYRCDKTGMGVSVMHFASNMRKNKVDATTIGIDYNGIRGLLPYAEFTSYRTHGKHVDSGTVEKLKGNFFVLGTKLTF